MNFMTSLIITVLPLASLAQSQSEGTSALSSVGVAAAKSWAEEPPVSIGGFSIQTFGMVGVSEGQTARLNVLSPGVQGPAATGILCSALLSFLDGQGAPLKSATVTVAPGKSELLDLDADSDLKLAINERKQIRATIQIPPALPPAGSTAPFCTLLPTLEIIDRVTGKTQIIVVETRPIPQVVTPAAARP